MIKKVFNKYLGLLLFIGTVIIGLNTYKDYGISWDEGCQRTLGTVTYNYLFHGDDLSYKHADNKVYGVGFELPLIILEKALHLHDIRDIYLMRHLVTHLFFLLGAFAFFLLIDFLYHNKLLATIGFLLLIANPLIYGHSFFNTKDIPFLSMFIICFLFAAIAFKKNTYAWYIMLGVVCGLLTNMRIMGILLIGCISIFFILDIIMSKHDRELRKKTIRSLLIFTCSSFMVLIITWPYLYSNPGQNFIDAFKCMAKYPWIGIVLFGGTNYKSVELPSCYGITWFSISNPLIYLCLGLFGIVYFSIRFIKDPKLFIFDKVLRNHSLFIFCFIEPLLAVFILRSVLYDAWRQLYFIYPPFILMGIFGLNYLLKTKIKLPVLVLLISAISYTGFYMISNFPNQHVYFNEFVRKDSPEYLRKNFELDYWGTSYKGALEYILKNDTSQTINVKVSEFSGKQNVWLLQPEERKRINFVDDVSIASYFASSYRNHPEDYDFKQKVYSIKVLNSTIMVVYKLK